MWWNSAAAGYLYALEFVAIALAVLILVSGLDDLIIDTIYWARRAWRAATIYRTHRRLSPRALYQPVEKPFAIMVPAWQETGVIGNMAELAATTLDYENYHIFVGTYPNDPDTQRDVEHACARFRNVHKVVCARPGPTSKADCLNNIVDAIFQFERRANLEFAGFILHDAEDVVSEMELRLFNYLVDRKDLIQIPVYPFERRWYDFTSAHYMDEFAELHGKDISVREAVAGQVPSAGVGTCFSRRAMMALLADGDGIAFDVQSLTEDYDIGIRLQAKGMAEIFVRFPVVKPEQRRSPFAGLSAREASVICVREFFPRTVAAAVRQKSRWIIGIVYQGYKTHGWTTDWTLNYFLWRDRKGAINNFVSFFSCLVLLQFVALWLYQALVPGGETFRFAFTADPWLHRLYAADVLLMLNRMLQRMFFVASYYGPLQGLLSAPRILWGNVINFLANCRAIRQIVHHGDPRRVSWDKTSHDFPVLGDQGRSRRPLGEILVAHGAISEEQLQHALLHRATGLKLGSWLVHEGIISSTQLAAAVAEQCDMQWEVANLLRVDAELIRQLPRELALHYAVLPLREEDGVLVLATEAAVDPVSAAALARKLGRRVHYVVVPKGQVTVGLRHWHLQAKAGEGRHALDEAVAAGRIAEGDSDRVWQEYVSRQLLFTEILMSLGHLDAAALNAALLRHDCSAMRLGDYMVAQGMVSPTVIRDALELQAQLQGSMRSLLDQEIVPAPEEEATPA